MLHVAVRLLGSFFFFFFILFTFSFLLFPAVPLVSLSASMFYMQLQPGVLSN